MQWVQITLSIFISSMSTTVYWDISINYVDSLSIYTVLVATHRHCIVHGCLSIVAVGILCYTWNCLCIFSDQLCRQFVYIYSPCCNWSSLCFSHMRLCDWRQCDVTRPTFNGKQFAASWPSTHCATRSFVVHGCIINCGCWHSLLHLERLMMSYL